MYSSRSEITILRLDMDSGKKEYRSHGAQTLSLLSLRKIMNAIALVRVSSTDALRNAFPFSKRGRRRPPPHHQIDHL